MDQRKAVVRSPTEQSDLTETTAARPTSRASEDSTRTATDNSAAKKPAARAADAVKAADGSKAVVPLAIVEMRDRWAIQARPPRHRI